MKDQPQKQNPQRKPQYNPKKNLPGQPGQPGQPQFKPKHNKPQNPNT